LKNLGFSSNNASQNVNSTNSSVSKSETDEWMSYKTDYNIAWGSEYDPKGNYHHGGDTISKVVYFFNTKTEAVMTKTEEYNSTRHRK
jgi:hypothetical protein